MVSFLDQPPIVLAKADTVDETPGGNVVAMRTKPGAEAQRSKLSSFFSGERSIGIFFQKGTGDFPCFPRGLKSKHWGIRMMTLFIGNGMNPQPQRGDLAQAQGNALG